MVHFLDCASEIRQNILSYLLPNEIRAIGSSSRTSAVLPLILSCQTLKSDVLQLFSSWSPTFRFDCHRDILEVSTSAEASEIRTLSLRLFAGINLKGEVLHGYGMWYEAAQDMVPWAQSVKDLPNVGVKTVILDLTPVPMWMVTQRPDWVRSIVLDDRCRLFLSSQEEAAVRLIEKMCSRYGNEVAIQIGGQLSSRGGTKRLVQAVIDRARTEHMRRVEFKGDWVGGEKENPVHLSLPHISCRWGIATDGRHMSDWSREHNFVLKSRRGDRPAKPDLDFEKLGRIDWSKDSTTSYFINARDNERDARETLTRILAFALENKQGSTKPVLEFPPAAKARRKLTHNIGKDLGLRSESVGDEGEKFVRISYMPFQSVDQDEEEETAGRSNIPTQEGSVVHAQIASGTGSRCDPEEDSISNGQPQEFETANSPDMRLCLKGGSGSDKAKRFKNRKMPRASRLWLAKAGAAIWRMIRGQGG